MGIGCMYFVFGLENETRKRLESFQDSTTKLEEIYPRLHSAMSGSGEGEDFHWEGALTLQSRHRRQGKLLLSLYSHKALRVCQIQASKQYCLKMRIVSRELEVGTTKCFGTTQKNSLDIVD